MMKKIILFSLIVFLQCFALVVDDAFTETSRDLPFMAGERWWCSQGYNGQTSHRGENALDFNFDTGSSDFHKPLLAPDNALVFVARETSKNTPSYGKVVLLRYSDNTYERFAHMDDFTVVAGESIRRGQVIGFVGITGTKAVHLHCNRQASSNPRALDPHEYKHNSVFITRSVVLRGVPECCECENYRNMPDPDRYLHTSLNSALFDQAFARYGSWQMGQKEYEMWDVEKAKAVGSAYHPWLLAWNSNDLYGSNGIPRNCYIQHFNGGVFGDSAIVYDGLSGGRQAYVIRSGFWAYWTNSGGPRSALGMPITEEYLLSNGETRQDFQLGYLLYHQGAKPEITRNNYRKATPGWTEKGWDPKVSYRIASVYNNRGRAKILGEATDIVRIVSDRQNKPNILKQQFQYGVVTIYENPPMGIGKTSTQTQSQDVSMTSTSGNYSVDPAIFTDTTLWHWSSLDLSSQARVYYAPTSGVSTVAYTHAATGNRHVTFAGVNGRVYEFTSVNGGMGWTSLDLSALAPVPYMSLQSSVTAYGSEVSDDRYVAAQGENRRIYEFRYDAPSGNWSSADLSALAPVAYADPAADITALVSATDNRYVLFTGDNKRIYELTYHAPFDVWTAADLSALAPVPYVASGTSPMVYQDSTSGERFVLFTGENARIQLITITPSETEETTVSGTTTQYAPGQVTSLDLSSQAPVGWADTSTEPVGCINPLTSDHFVIFNTQDQRLNALRKKGGEDTWTSFDLTSQAPVPLTAPGTHPTCFTNPFSGVFFVVFTGNDGHIWQLSFDGDAWTSFDISAQVPLAYAATATSPTASTNPINGNLFFSFIGDNARIQSMQYDYQP